MAVLTMSMMASMCFLFSFFFLINSVGRVSRVLITGRRSGIFLHGLEMSCVTKMRRILSIKSESIAHCQVGGPGKLISYLGACTNWGHDHNLAMHKGLRRACDSVFLRCS